MPKRTRSKMETPQSQKRAKTTKAAPKSKTAETVAVLARPQLDLSAKSDTTITVEDPTTTVTDVSKGAKTETKSIITPNDEEDDLINFEDLDDEPLATETGPVDSTFDETLLDSSDKVTTAKKVETAAPEGSLDDKVDTGSTKETPEEAAPVEDKGVKEESVAEPVETIKDPKEIAGLMIANATRQQLMMVPQILEAGGLKNEGDTIKVQFNAHGLTFELSLGIVGASEDDDDPAADYADATEEVLPETVVETVEKHPDLTIDVDKAQNALQTAGPLTSAAPTPKTGNGIVCKFGASCTKGEQCPFDHSAQVVTKKKMCGFLNTAVGCAKGNECPFSHDHEDRKCTRSTRRVSCANGFKCAFKHDDDYQEDGSAKTAIKKQTLVADAAQKAAFARASREESIASQFSPAILSPANHSAQTPVPSGPKLGKGAGQKRRVGQGVEGQITQRSRGNNQMPHNQNLQQHDGRGGGGAPQRARGGARGRGPARGRGGRGGRGGKQQAGDAFKVKGAAAQHND